MIEETAQDSELLRRYRTSGCGEAFRVLVERHAGMVCATAQRILGHDLWAQDVMQAVFVDFARKGRAMPESIIPGAWLYRSACRHALNRQRTESRHRRRMKTHAAMNESAPADETWAAMTPHLDAALSSLGNSDRTALVLRFLENQPLGEVGIAMGTTEDAAQKRVSRALTKMRSLLQKRGVCLSAAVLGSQALRETVQARVPPIAFESLVKNALTAGTGPVSFWTALTCNVRTAFIAAGFSSLAGGAVWRAARAPSAPPEALSVAGPSHGRVPGSAMPSQSASRTGGAFLSGLREPTTAQEALDAMLAILNLPDNYHRRLLVSWLSQQDVLEKLPLGELFTLMETCGNREVITEWGSPVLMQYALLDGAGAFKAARRSNNQSVSACFALWANRDPKTAFQWVIAEVEVSNTMEPAAAWNLLDSAVVEGLLLGATSLERAVTRLRHIPGPWRHVFIRRPLHLAPVRYETDAEATLRADLLLVSKIPEPEIRNCLELAIIGAFQHSSSYAFRPPKEILELLTRVLPSGSVLPQHAFLSMNPGPERDLIALALRSAPRECKEAVMLEMTGRSLRLGWRDDTRKVFEEWVKSLPPGSPGRDRVLLRSFVNRKVTDKLFETSLPATDPQLRDAVAGCLQHAAATCQQETLWRLYRESKVARGWSPEFRARVEEIISTANP